MNISFKKGNEVYLAKNNKLIAIVYFSHWEKSHGNGNYWLDTAGVRHHINEIA